MNLPLSNERAAVLRPAGIVAGAALLAALILPPFKAGHVFGASGAGAGSLLGGVLWWIAVGLAAGVMLAGRRPSGPPTVRALAAGVERPLRFLAPGALAGLLVAVVLGRAAAGGVAVVAFLSLTPGLVPPLAAAVRRAARSLTCDQVALAVALAVAGAAAGAAAGALVPPTVALVLGAGATAALVVAARGSRAAGGTAAVLLVALAVAGPSEPIGPMPNRCRARE